MSPVDRCTLFAYIFCQSLISPLYERSSNNLLWQVESFIAIWKFLEIPHFVTGDFKCEPLLLKNYYTNVSLGGGTMVAFCGQILFLGGGICKHRCANSRGVPRGQPPPPPPGWPLKSVQVSEFGIFTRFVQNAH